MNKVNWEKSLEARFEIDGVDNEFECRKAGALLLRTYNLTCDIVNKGGIERFNSEWDRLHADKSNDEYELAYSRYFKSVADKVVDLFATAYGFNIVYRLRACEPCTLNPEKGYCTIYGYKTRMGS